MLIALTSMALASCGGGDSGGDSNEPSGNFPVEITTAQFPTRQRLAQASDLRIGVKNTGKKDVPAFVVTISIAGPAGHASTLPFSIRDPQVGLAQPDRPVWILDEGWPKKDSELDANSGGATTADPKTFDFGPLKPGETVNATWRVTPVKAGDYTVTYRVDAGLSGEAKAVTDSGNPPLGSFHVNITSVPPQTRINGAGDVVTIEPGGGTTPGD